MTDPLPAITIPADLLPADGRFGCGPSKVRPEAVDALAAAAASYLGTSHRQATVRFTVSQLRNGLAELFALPDGYEIMLGNGGTDRLLGRRHLRPDRAAQPAPQLRRVLVQVRRRPAGRPAPRRARDHRVAGRAPTPRPGPSEAVDAYALTHNETSTGVAMPLRPARRVPTTTPSCVVDATSAAGGLRFDPPQVDVYYFAPQKCLASDGGLWLAAVSPAAVERIERLAGIGPLDPGVARPRHRPRQLPQGPDLQHPGAGHVFLAVAAGRVDQRQRRPRVGGRRAATGRPRPSTRWAEASAYATPVRGRRRPSAATWSPPSTSTTRSTPTWSRKVLRANGIVDTESYRKLGRNQLRIAMFPAIDPDDVEALTPASTTWWRPSAEPTRAIGAACIGQTASGRTLVDGAGSRATGGCACRRLAEVRAQLTGPGGAVRGRPPRWSTASRCRSTRTASRTCAPSPRSPPLRGDEQPFIVYGDRRIGFGEFFGLANSASAALRDRFGLGHGDRVAVLSANNPEWCLASGPRSTSARSSSGSTAGGRPTRSSTACRTAGAKVLVADRKRFERIADELDELPDLEARVPDRRRPRRLRPDDPRLHRFDELTTEPDRRLPRRRRSTRTTTPSSSTRAAPPAGPRARSRPTAT